MYSIIDYIRRLRVFPVKLCFRSGAGVWVGCTADVTNFGNMIAEAITSISN